MILNMIKRTVDERAFKMWTEQMTLGLRNVGPTPPTGIYAEVGDFESFDEEWEQSGEKEEWLHGKVEFEVNKKGFCYFRPAALR